MGKDFITNLYRDVLGRAPDASGATRWAQTLADSSAQTVVLGFANNPEFTAMAAQDLKDWMRAIRMVTPTASAQAGATVSWRAACSRILSYSTQVSQRKQMCWTLSPRM
jgi:hypothetical protein